MKTKARAQFMRFLRHNWVTEKFLLAEDFFGHLLEIHCKENLGEKVEISPL